MRRPLRTSPRDSLVPRPRAAGGCCRPNCGGCRHVPFKAWITTRKCPLDYTGRNRSSKSSSSSAVRERSLGKPSSVGRHRISMIPHPCWQRKRSYPSVSDRRNTRDSPSTTRWASPASFRHGGMPGTPLCSTRHLEYEEKAIPCCRKEASRTCQPVPRRPTESRMSSTGHVPSARPYTGISNWLPRGLLGRFLDSVISP
jgi:hypothetical protein